MPAVTRTAGPRAGPGPGLSRADPPGPDWAGSTPQELAEECLAVFAERFDFVLDDLRALTSPHPVLAEGFGLRPKTLALLLDSPGRMIVMVPTEEFRQHQLRTLPRAGALSAVVADPVRGQANRVERDRLLAADAIRTAREHGVRVLEVDGSVDAEGLDAVSMRRVGAELGTGAASLYRYVETRGELLDLMTDATAAEYDLPAPSDDCLAGDGVADDRPSGDWLAGLVAIGEQTRAIARRHRWLAGLTLARPVIGPNSVTVIEHFLTLLAGHPALLSTKLEAFAMLNGLTATTVLYEQAGGPALQERNVAYLSHVIASGSHPRLTELVSGSAPAAADVSADRYPVLLSRVLLGILGANP
jgi:AcrR family transcriptional regulator